MTNEELKMIIGNNIKKYRKKNGLTQDELASLIGCTTALIGALESSKMCQGVSVYNLYKISRVLNVSIDKLFKDVI